MVRLGFCTIYICCHAPLNSSGLSVVSAHLRAKLERQRSFANESWLQCPAMQNKAKVLNLSSFLQTPKVGAFGKMVELLVAHHNTFDVERK